VPFKIFRKVMMAESNLYHFIPTHRSQKLKLLVTCDVTVCHERHPFLCHPLGYMKNVNQQFIQEKLKKKS
jgi:hypothetical protein